MPLRNEPTHRAEQVSQLLYGEKLEILEIDEKEWAKVRCFWDDYEGWCKFSQLAVITKKEFARPVKFLTATHTDKIVFEESEMWLPLGADLTYLKGGKTTINGNTGKYKGKKLTVSDLSLTGEHLKTAALKYMNAPYQWGGRSIAGIDCSGLTQMAFKLCNTTLPRDASQQAQQGTLVDFLQNAQCGDIAFFDNSDGRIVHVGILLDAQNIIHATDSSGRVVIDRIDPSGIISVSQRKRTHNLRFVKRFIKP
jgi:cell wall-associated NlpC family hydrolase